MRAVRLPWRNWRRGGYVGSPEYHCGILFQYYLRRKLVEALTRELAAANDMTCDVYDVLIDTQRELGRCSRIRRWRITCTPCRR